MEHREKTSSNRLVKKSSSTLLLGIAKKLTFVGTTEIDEDVVSNKRKMNDTVQINVSVLW